MTAAWISKLMIISYGGRQVRLTMTVSVRKGYIYGIPHQIVVAMNKENIQAQYNSALPLLLTT
jgi:hypothetical protein